MCYLIHVHTCVYKKNAFNHKLILKKNLFIFPALALLWDIKILKFHSIPWDFSITVQYSTQRSTLPAALPASFLQTQYSNLNCLQFSIRGNGINRVFLDFFTDASIDRKPVLEMGWLQVIFLACGLRWPYTFLLSVPRTKVCVRQVPHNKFSVVISWAWYAVRVEIILCGLRRGHILGTDRIQVGKHLRSARF